MNITIQHSTAILLSTHIRLSPTPTRLRCALHGALPNARYAIRYAPDVGEGEEGADDG